MCLYIQNLGLYKLTYHTKFQFILCLNICLKFMDHILELFFLTCINKTGNTGFEFLVDSSSPKHYPSLALSKPWESYRLRVLPSQTGGVTSLPYITTATPTSSEGIPLYPSSQAVSLPGTGGSVTELRGTSDPKVRTVKYQIVKPTCRLPVRSPVL